MWTHYLKVALRALASQRFFSFVNLVGLSVGLASVIAISLYVRQELGHDRWLADHERLFRIDTVETIPDRESLAIARAPGPLGEAMERDFPEVEAVTRGYTAPLNVRRGAETFAEEVMVADPDFFAVLGLPFASGDAALALSDPASIVLSERAAEKYFGRGEALGRRLTLMVPEPREFVVSAVFRTIPEASHMAFDVAIPHGAYFRPSSDGSQTIPETWAGAYFHTYARLRAPADAGRVQRGLPAFTDRHVPQWITDQLRVPAHEFYDFRLIPVRDVHFDGAAIDAMKPPGSRNTVAALAGVAGLILLIAGINFANLSAARSVLRAREVALRKVVGARRRQILAQFLTEAALLTAFAGLLALALVEISLPWIGSRLGASLPPPSTWEVKAGLIFLVLMTAAAAGFYPSLVASSIRPAEVFRRGEASAGGSRVRTLLVTLQFTISIALIVVTLVMAMQTRFAGRMDLGFARENMLVVRVPADAGQEVLARSFRDAIARRPEVVSAALSSSVPSDRSEDNLTVTRPQAVRPVQLGFHRVDARFFANYAVAPLAGRLGSTRDATEEGADALINMAALRRLGFARPEDAIGQVLQGPRGGFTVIGVVPDLHFRSLHETVRDELYIVDETPGGAVSIRYRAEELPAFLAAVDRSWASLAPDKPIVREFLDDLLAALYERERASTTLVSLFAAVAIVLSCLGLAAMVAFTLQRRTREIALRKVMGAGSADIARLLVWQFSRPVLAANLIAWPVAWLILSNWLNRFAFRIEMPLSAFLIASGAALLIAWAAVGAHTIRMAGQRPIRALREL